MKKLLKVNTNQLVGASASFIGRLGILPSNVTPLGSFGFFGGNPLLYGLSIVAFDLLIKGSYRGFLFTYVGFAAYPLLGWLTRKSQFKQALALPLASFLFFLFSNFGVWWYWYDHTWHELLLCYSLAVPFYQRTLIGDLVFGYGYMLYRAYGRSVIHWLQQRKLIFSS